MKHLKIFESKDQIWDVNEAREVLSQIYTIEDEVRLGPRETDFSDFLVDINQFLKYMREYDGCIAGNHFQDQFIFPNQIDSFIRSLEGIGISPVIFIAPFWMGRRHSDIAEFGDVYADTIYIEVIEDVSEWQMNQIKELSDADEIDIMDAVSGKQYLRIWWD